MIFYGSDNLFTGITGRTVLQHQQSIIETSRGQNNRSMMSRGTAAESDASQNSSPAKFAYKDYNTAKFSNTQNFALRTEEEDLIQKVSDVMKTDQCDKLVRGSVDNGLNTTSSTSSNHSQKSSESSNSFYASIPNRQQSSECDPVISLMLSNNQPPLQLHSGIYSGLQEANSDKQHRHIIERKDFQMQPTYANFISQNKLNGSRPVPARFHENAHPRYSPGTYAVSIIPHF